MSTEVYDAVIVGGSFAGLAAALQLGRARRRVLVIDAGLPRNRFARASHGFLGQDGRAPAAILDDARAQLAAYRTVRFHPGEATGARSVEEGFEVETADGSTARASRLVLATGVVDELPDVPGLRERWGKTVLHCPYCHGFEVADRRLGILAGGEMSVHLALLLPDWSADVTLFIDRAFTPTAEQLAALSARGVRVELREVHAVVGEAPSMGGVRLRDGEVVPVDALFTASRIRMASPLAERLGCAFHDGPQGPVIQVDESRQTSVPGVYAAGDAARTRHTVSFAVADGVMAGVSAHQSLALGPPAVAHR